jgi:GTP-binding protein
MKIIDASFMQSAQSIKDSPSPDVAEVAFIGRSNVGKSSLLNTLTHRKNLAKSSSTPGKTQLLNYFNIKFKNSNEEAQTPHMYARFVDLPGFGYARVSKTLKEAWNKNLTGYLQSRPCLQIFIHLIDARHPNLEIDINVDEFLNTIKRPDQIIIHAYTKIDKLKKNDLNKLKQQDPEGIFISNLKKTGMDKLEQTISEYLFGN